MMAAECRSVGIFWTWAEKSAFVVSRVAAGKGLAFWMIWAQNSAEIQTCKISRCRLILCNVTYHRTSPDQKRRVTSREERFTCSLSVVGNRPSSEETSRAASPSATSRASAHTSASAFDAYVCCAAGDVPATSLRSIGGAAARLTARHLAHLSIDGLPSDQSKAQLQLHISRPAASAAAARSEQCERRQREQ